MKVTFELKDSLVGALIRFADEDEISVDSFVEAMISTQVGVRKQIQADEMAMLREIINFPQGEGGDE